MQVNPYQDTPERRERRRHVALAIGLLFALGGSYIAVTEAFGDQEFCNQLGCFDTQNPQDIWFGLVACALGAVLMWRNRRPVPVETQDDPRTR